MFNRALELRVAPGSRASTTVISAAGALVLENVSKFQEAWRAIQTDALVIDLSGVTYMDSVAIGSLVHAQISCTNKNRSMALSGVPERVKQLLKSTRVDSFFKFYSDVQAAESGLASPQDAG